MLPVGHSKVLFLWQINFFLLPEQVRGLHWAQTQPESYLDCLSKTVLKHTLTQEAFLIIVIS